MKNFILIIASFVFLQVDSNSQDVQLDVEGNVKVTGKIEIRNSAASKSVVIGYENLSYNGAGSHNAIFGYRSGSSIDFGAQNSFFGSNAGQMNMDGSLNSFFGNIAGGDNNGHNNTFIGAEAGRLNTSGGSNVFVGQGSGGNINGGSNTLLGSRSHLASTGLSQAMALGSNAIVGCHSCAVIGGTGFWAVNVGINTESPLKRLDVHGEMIIRDENKIGTFESSSENAYIEFSPNSGANSSTIGYFSGTVDKYFFVDTPEGSFGEFVIRANGDVGIGVLDPAFKLQVGQSGDGSKARANEWSTFSDRRWKNNLKIIESPIEILRSINGYFFQWNDGEDKSRQVGVIAQEVEKMLPEVVSTDSEGYKSVDYSKLTTLLIESEKKQQELIDKQRTEIDQLKKELSDIKSLIKTYIVEISND